MKIRIKKSSIRFLAILLFDLFVILKMRRAFSLTTQEGGIWNLIQLAFVVFGFFALLRNLKSVFRNVEILCIDLFCLLNLITSLLVIDSFSVSALFSLSKTLYAGMTMTLFYCISLKSKDFIADMKSTKYTYYIAGVILISALGRHMLTGGVKAYEAGAVADIYYLLGLLPMLLIITSRKRQIVPLVFAGIAVLLTQKRTGLLIFLCVVVVYFFLDKSKIASLTSVLKTAVGFCAALIVGYFVFRYMDATFNLRVVERMSNLVADGGSGRDVLWMKTWDAIWSSNTIKLLFGHGVGAIFNLIGINSHNDFLQVGYDYGLIALILYIAFFISLFRTASRMYHTDYPYAAQFLCSLIVSLFVACFSFYIVDATYITSGCFVQGFLLADFRKYLDRGGAEA